MKAIIVEDEQSAANWLVTALGRLDAGIAIIGMFSEPTEAINGIRNLKPELVFLDIDLKHHINGFGILESLKDREFKVIFTTSHGEYALDAFEYNAVQFLLKPYGDENLKDAIERAKIITIGEQRQNIDDLNATEKFLNKQSDLLPVRKANGDINIININDCTYLKHDGKAVIVYFNDGKEEEAEFRPFTEWAALLQKRGFVRIHQKFIVNIRYIKKYVNRNKADITEPIQVLYQNKTGDKIKVMGDGGAVILTNCDRLAVSRAFSRALKDALSIF